MGLYSTTTCLRIQIPTSIVWHELVDLAPKGWQSRLFQMKLTPRYLTKYKIDLKLTSRNCPKKLICLLTLRAVNMPCTFLELNAAFCYFFSFVVQNIITLKNDTFIYRIISKRIKH